MKPFLQLCLAVLCAGTVRAASPAQVYTITTNKFIAPTAFTTSLIAQPDAASARTLLGVGSGGSFTNANLVGGTVTGMTNSDLTASRVMVSGATGIPTNSSVTSATLLFLDATSSVQTQLDGKVATATLGGYVTNLGGLATNLSVSGMTNLDLTASTVPYTDANKKLTSSAVTATELGYVSGVTSALQTQLDAKAATADAVLLAGTQTISGVKSFTNANNFTGTFTGNGAALTNLSASSVLSLYAEGARVGTAPSATNLNSVAIGAGATTSTATNAFAAGRNASATGNFSTAVGDASVASGVQSAAFGYDARATVDAAVAVGQSVTASASFSLATGFRSSADLYGKHAHAAGSFAANGDAQTGVLVAQFVTTSASATNLWLGSSFPLTLANNTTWSFHIRVAARRTDATGENMDWTFDGLVSRDANAASTALVGDVIVTPRPGVTTSLICTVTANPTAGSLQINVTGEAAKTHRWVARVETVEVSN